MSGGFLIAIVDDDNSAREATADLVKALDFETAVFASATDLLRSGNIGQIACLICDVRMPGMNGLELHMQLTANGLSLPTILMTAYPDDVARTRALAAGVRFYLEKPLEADRLMKCIHSALGRDGNGSTPR